MVSGEGGAGRGVYQNLESAFPYTIRGRACQSQSDIEPYLSSDGIELRPYGCTADDEVPAWKDMVRQTVRRFVLVNQTRCSLLSIMAENTIV